MFVDKYTKEVVAETVHKFVGDLSLIEQHTILQDLDICVKYHTN